MRQDKDQQVCVSTCLGQVSDCEYIVGQLNPRKIFDVFVSRIDVVGQVDFSSPFGVHLFLVDPHVDSGLKVRQTFAVATDKSGNGAAPVAAANDTDLVDLPVFKSACDLRIIRGAVHRGGCSIRRNVCCRVVQR